jgi:hypothetical protein
VLRRWAVQYGPEFAESRAACSVPVERLEGHLKAIRLSLERDPLRYSTPFVNEARRVIETTDYTEPGFVLTAFVVLYDPFIAEVKWIEARPLPEEDLD